MNPTTLEPAIPASKEHLSSNITVFDMHPKIQSMQRDVLDGLSQPNKTISSKYFYDEKGSQLFDQITEIKEYYIPRVEKKLLKECTPFLAKSLKENTTLVELGSGGSEKAKHMIQQLHLTKYMPIDISKEHIVKDSEKLSTRFPALKIYPTCADFTKLTTLPQLNHSTDYFIFFPGSTIGNFPPPKATQILKNIHSFMQTSGTLLIGIDHKKDKTILERAYNDKQNITADFNLNILSHINNKLNSDFDTSNFIHKALYDEQKGCINMYLESKKRHAISLLGNSITFSKGERIHTESSYKYTLDEFTQLAAQANLSLVKHWIDSDNYFMLLLFKQKK